MNRNVKWKNGRRFWPPNFIWCWGLGVWRIFDMGLELNFVTGEMSTGCLFFGLPLGIDQISTLHYLDQLPRKNRTWKYSKKRLHLLYERLWLRKTADFLRHLKTNQSSAFLHLSLSALITVRGNVCKRILTNVLQMRSLIILSLLTMDSVWEKAKLLLYSIHEFLRENIKF